MGVRFTIHSLHQMTERKISRHEVEMTVEDPEKVSQRPNGRIRAVRRRDEKYLLIVIYEIRQSRITVVTAFITSKIYKYL